MDLSLPYKIQEALDLDDHESLIELSRQALSFFPKEVDPREWARLNFILGNSLRETTRHPGELREAIQAYQNAITVFSELQLQHSLRAVLAGLAMIYADWKGVERAEFLDQAINYYHQALAITPASQEPGAYATLCHNLGDALCAKQGSNAMEQAVHYFQEAVAHSSKHREPLAWAQSMRGLGNALADRLLGDRSENIEQGLIHLQQSLEVQIEMGVHSEAARTRHDLGLMYRSRVRGDAAMNIEKSIELLEASLQHRKRGEDPLKWAESAHSLAGSYRIRIQGDHRENQERGIELYQGVLEVWSKDGTPLEWAEAQMNLGNLLSDRVEGRKQKNLYDAIECYKRALDVFDSEKTPKDWALAKRNLASTYASLTSGDHFENLAKAIEHYTETLDVCKPEVDPHGWAQIIQGLANAYAKRSTKEDLEKAFSLYRQALTRRTKDREPHLWAKTVANLASAMLDHPDKKRFVPEAIELLEEVTTLDELKPSMKGRVHKLLGSAWERCVTGTHAENLRKAIHHTQKALDHHDSKHAKDERAKIFMNMATLECDLYESDPTYDLEIVIERFQEALTLYQGDPSHHAYVLFNLGRIYWLRKNGDRTENIEIAIRYSEQSFDLTDPKNQPKLWLNLLVNLGVVYSDRQVGSPTENAQKALGYLEQARAALTEHTDIHLKADICHNLGEVYGEVGEVEQARACFEEALTIRTLERDPRKWAATTRSLAALLADFPRVDSQDRERAVELYRTVLNQNLPEMSEPDKAMVWGNLGIVYQKLAQSGHSGAFAEGLKAFDKALETYTLALYPEDYRWAQMGKANLYADAGDWPASALHSEEAIGANELLFEQTYTEPGRLALSGQTTDPYELAAYSLMRCDQLGKAVWILERGKARALNQRLAFRNVAESQDPAQRGQLQELQQTIVDLEAKMRRPGSQAYLRTLAGELKTVRETLNQLLKPLLPAMSSLTEQQILDAVPTDSVFVTFLVTNRGGAVFIVPAGLSSLTSDHVVSLPDLKPAEIAAWFGDGSKETFSKTWLGAEIAFKNAGKNQRDDQTKLEEIIEAGELRKKALVELCHILDQEVMSHLSERLHSLNCSEDLFLSPHGPLIPLPLHAAYHSHSDTYFMDEWTVAFTPSITTLIHQSSKQSGERSLFAVASPGDDLPNAKLEGNLIGSFFKQKSILSGKMAEKKASMNAMGHHNYWHFSCHGVSSMTNIFDSYLELAGEERLTLANILDNVGPLDARLAVLSACDTGRFDMQHTLNEFLGLPFGFLQAGCQAVISTLWTVDDGASSLLMTEFYRLHLREGKNPARALTMAMRHLRTGESSKLEDLYKNEDDQMVFQQAVNMGILRHFEHPIYWAPFVIYGR